MDAAQIICATRNLNNNIKNFPTDYDLFSVVHWCKNVLVGPGGPGRPLGPFSFFVGHSGGAVSPLPHAQESNLHSGQ